MRYTFPHPRQQNIQSLDIRGQNGLWGNSKPSEGFFFKFHPLLLFFLSYVAHIIHCGAHKQLDTSLVLQMSNVDSPQDRVNAICCKRDKENVCDVILYHPTNIALIPGNKIFPYSIRTFVWGLTGATIFCCSYSATTLFSTSQ